MSNKLIETISPRNVFNRVLLGIFIIAVSYFFWEDLFPQSDQIYQWVCILIGVSLFLTGWRSVSNPLRAIQYFDNPKKVVSQMIHQWLPENYLSEYDFEKSLHNFLKKELPWVKITRQYSSGRVKCDLAVGKDVMIELKVDFKSTQKLQRLIGQLEIYRKEWDKPIIVVLIGETAEDLLHDLNKHTQQLVKLK